MKFRQLSVSLFVLLVFAAVGYSALKVVTATGSDMTGAAEQFVKSLNGEQRAKTVLAYDIPQRTDWHFIPKPTRKGLQVKEMDDSQRKAAHALLRSALSEVGYG